MYAHFYAGMQFTALPLVGLAIFFTTFVAAIVRVSLRSRRQELEAASRLPFDDKHDVSVRFDRKGEIR